MTQYLVAIHHPDDFEAFSEPETTQEDIRALNREMVAAGIRVFVGGLAPVSEAVAVRRRPDGNLLATDGPYLETKEHIGGFWVLELASRDDALACRAPVEVRAFNEAPRPRQ